MLELSVSLLTAGVALTLVPAIRRSTPRLIEVALWMGLVGAALIMVVEVANPRASELTMSVGWGAGQLVHTEAAILLAGVKGWAVANRFDIATMVVLGAGADALAIAFMGAVRGARSYPRVRLNDWYVLPRTPIPDRVPDPLAGPNRTLPDATWTGLRSARHTVLTSPVVERLAILAAHVLGPGQLRLTLVKIGLGIERSGPALDPQGSATIRPALAALKRGPGPNEDQRRRHRRLGPQNVSPRSVSGAAGNRRRAPWERKNAAAQPRHQRLAS